MTDGGGSIQELRATVARLRGPGGCPWDRKQTHVSLAECLIEECSELLDTIDHRDMEHMKEELGDVLLQVVMHAQIAEESDAFDLEMVAAQVNEKLIRRHPHVFGDSPVEEAEEALARWNEIKASERAAQSHRGEFFKPVPRRVPALLFARDIFEQVVEKRVAMGEGIDQEELQRLSDGLTERKAGEILFRIAAACRLAKIDPESALRRHTRRVMDQASATALAES